MVAIDVVSWFAPALQRRLEGEEESGEQVFGWEKNGFTRSEHVENAEYLLCFILLLIATFILQHYVSKVWHLMYLPEAGATIMLGMFISIFIRASGKDTTTGAISVLGFDSTLFMLGFLPPIIYNAGYSLKRRLFFANMGGILLLAIVGTVLSAFVVATGIYAFGKAGAAADITFMEGLCFGSLISATDPVSTLAIFVELKVDPTLFYLVFGESVINDAIAITLFKTTSKFVGYDIGAADVFIAIIDFFIIFLGSAVIGYLFGLLSAWLFKTVDLSRYRLVLVSVFVANVYVPFLFAETMQLSGVVAILFTAITTRRYVSQNIPAEAKRAAAFVFELLAFMAETSVFLFLGLSVFSSAASGGYNAGTIIFTWIFCQMGRAMHVYPLLEWVNHYREKRAVVKNRRPNLIPMRTKHMVFFSGLRGAVAYALANIFPDNLGNRNLFVATTMVMVLITIFINGGLTVKVLNYLGIDKDVNFSEYVEQVIYIYMYMDYSGQFWGADCSGRSY